jgi:hypothetical protein
MSKASLTDIDDDRLAVAARRVIQRHRLQDSDSDGGVVTPATPRASGQPDDINVLRLALDTMDQTIAHLQRLLKHREDVFAAALERIERNVAKAHGRIDALTDELAQINGRATLALDAMIDEHDQASRSIMSEYGGMLQLGRALLDDVEYANSELTGDHDRARGHKRSRDA